MASIALNFLMGRVLAERTGVKEEAGKNVVAAVTMGLGLTPVGVVLARHIALQRATAEAAATPSTPTPPAPPGGAGTPPGTPPGGTPPGEPPTAPTGSTSGTPKR